MGKRQGEYGRERERERIICKRGKKLRERRMRV